MRAPFFGCWPVVVSFRRERNWLTTEWSETVARVATEEKRWRNENWRSWLEWLGSASVLIEEIPIRVTVPRDPKDDPVVMAAVAARAQFIVAYDSDLLDLKKPYGIACATPRRFLGLLRRAGSSPLSKRVIH